MAHPCALCSHQYSDTLPCLDGSDAKQDQRRDYWFEATREVRAELLAGQSGQLLPRIPKSSILTVVTTGLWQFRWNVFGNISKAQYQVP